MYSKRYWGNLRSEVNGLLDVYIDVYNVLSIGYSLSSDHNNYNYVASMTNGVQLLYDIWTELNGQSYQVNVTQTELYRQSYINRKRPSHVRWALVCFTRDLNPEPAD